MRLRSARMEMMHGLGDSLYSRPVIRELAKSYERLYVTTSWPQFLIDIPNIKFLRPSIDLRTQNKNVSKNRHLYTTVIRDRVVERPRMYYNPKELELGKTVLRSLESAAGFKQYHDELSMDLPLGFLDGANIALPKKPYIFVRPGTVRTEWSNPQRNPDPLSLAQVVEWLRDRGYLIVSVADLQADVEWMIEPEPHADIVYHHGELHVDQMLRLLQGADAAVGGPGWLVPAVQITKTPTFMMLGGCQGHNRQQILTDKRVDSSMLYWAQVDRPCMCTIRDCYKCDKKNSRLADQFLDWTEMHQLLSDKQLSLFNSLPRRIEVDA